MDSKHLDFNKVSLLLRDHKFEEALRFIKINLTSNPKHVDSLYLGAVCTRYLKQFGESEKYIKRLLTYAPDMGRAYQEYAHMHRDKGNQSQAINYYRQACELNPALVASWKSLHTYFIELNDTAAAEYALEQINKFESLPSILLHINQILNEGNVKDAEKKCREYLKLHPKDTNAMALLSDIAAKLGHFDDAEFLLKSAISFNPENTELRVKYLLILRKRQKFIQTMEQAEYLCKKYPDNISFKSQKAIELMQSGNHESAITLMDEILNVAPRDTNTLTSKGHALKTLGRTDEAIKIYQSAYNSKQDHGEAFFSLANLKTYKFEDIEFDRMRDQIKRVDLPLKEKAYFHFALAQGCESKGQYEEAFNNLENGNRIKREQSKYTIKRMNKEIQAQIDVCDDEFFKKIGDGGYENKDPIFILGLPRSGSTLIEQIISSHSMVDGTLELPNILSMAQSLRGEDIFGSLGNYPQTMESLTLEQRLDMGKKYVDETKIHRKDAPRFTDKMPNNFRHIALIHLVLPNAKIIDARRYPLDCCFSMYKQLFAQGQEFTYGLAEASNYYNSYIKLMDHWNKVLPNKILQVNNEDVIDNLEHQVRRILDFLDLPFEQSCVSFHETERSVRTASSEQVRQPINTKGMGRWKPYATQLKPFLENIDNKLIKSEDIALINN